MASSTNTPKSFGILLFPGFEALDAFGPLEIVNALSLTHPDITLSIIAATLDPVSTALKASDATASSGSADAVPPELLGVVGQRVLPTHTITTAPALDVLIVPGGAGGFQISPPTAAWLRSTATPQLPHLITVCNGAAVVASSSAALDGRRATTNKAYWRECTAKGPRTHWVAKARWVRDGGVWTSSGVSAGMDATLAWVESVFGEGEARELANRMEFVRSEGESDDPFAALYGCEDVLPLEAAA